ncbi:MAG: fumarylacetoacetate hydrolase family protein [Bacteroidales bacterium]|nr:fumarylacetoacetate hydrolase family protein [Bacteroidales bacterium]MDD6581817.1 fumarylacetoacetate hydrolase family protein [Bacteroidales bacterium]
MKIICIGRNYLPHIQELGHKVPTEPTFFLKPESAMVIRNRPFFLPDFSQQVEYEVELIYRINKVGKYIQEKYAHTYYDAIGLGIDFTARDLQRNCIENGNPWEIAKAFDGSAVMSQFIDKEEFDDLNNLDFHLDLNGKTVQSGNSSEMIFTIDKIISYVSQFMTLKMGDVIYTGTPKGVGKVAINDRLEGWIGERKLLNFRVK